MQNRIWKPLGGGYTADEAASRLRGEFTFQLFGHAIHARRSDYKFPKGARVGRFRARLHTIRGTWVLYMRVWQTVLEAQVDDWDELTYEDLWRNPEAGFAFAREVMCRGV